jgi:amino acid permease
MKMHFLISSQLGYLMGMIELIFLQLLHLIQDCMKTAQNHKNNIFISYFILLITFFVLIFATMNFYQRLQISLDTYETQENTREKLKQELTGLNTLQANLNVEGSEDLKKLTPYLAEINEKTLIDYFYSYARKENLENDVIIIRSVNISKESLNDI